MSANTAQRTAADWAVGGATRIEHEMQKKWLIARYNDLGYYAGKGALLKVILDGFETESDALKELETKKDWPSGNYTVLPYYVFRGDNDPSTGRDGAR